MSQCAVKFYFSASPLYMFRAAHTPIIRSIETCRVDLQRNKTSLYIVTSVGYSIEYYDARNNKYQVAKSHLPSKFIFFYINQPSITIHYYPYWENAFHVLLTVHLSIILDNDQLDTHLLYFTIRPIYSSTCFEHYMLIIRRLNCIDAASGFVLSVSGLRCRGWERTAS